MTLRKSARRRRRTTLNAIPKNIAEWFSGSRRFTFFAYTLPDSARMDEYWAAWLEEHPSAVKPEGLDGVLESAPKLRRLLAKTPGNGDE